MRDLRNEQANRRHEETVSPELLVHHHSAVAGLTQDELAVLFCSVSLYAWARENGAPVSFYV